MENKPTRVIEVIEDDSSMRSALSSSLSKNGFSVISASNGKDGLFLALKDRPDLIFLDIKMPIMDGIETLRMLRADEWGKSAKVVILTNLGDDEHIKEAMEHSAFDYFIKADTKLEDLVALARERLSVV